MLSSFHAEKLELILTKWEKNLDLQNMKKKNLKKAYSFVLSESYISTLATNLSQFLMNKEFLSCCNSFQYSFV